MQPVRLSQTGVGISPWFMPNFHMAPFLIDIECSLTGAATFNIETTMDDYWTPATQVVIAGPRQVGAVIVRPTTINAATAAASLQLTNPCTGWRLNVTAGTGTVTVEATQAGIVNY